MTVSASALLGDVRRVIRQRWATLILFDVLFKALASIVDLARSAWRLGLFDEVKQFHWQALDLGPQDELGQHISLEGIYDGNSVWLRVLAEPPERFDNGRIANAYELDFKDVW